MILAERGESVDDEKSERWSIPTKVEKEKKRELRFYEHRVATIDEWRRGKGQAKRVSCCDREREIDWKRFEGRQRHRQSTKFSSSEVDLLKRIFEFSSRMRNFP